MFRLIKITLFISIFCSQLVAAEQPKQRVELSGEAYDQHVELSWHSPVPQDKVYLIKSSVNGGEWSDRAKVTGGYLLDYVGDLGSNLNIAYRLFEVTGSDTVLLDEEAVKTRTFSDEELLDMVQRYTFRYFWDYADRKTGWARERAPDYKGNIIATGATGFGIMSLITGAERGWVTRESAVQRMALVMNYLKKLKRVKGMWAHWYYSDAEKIFPFSKYDDGGDVVESAFMAQGLLTARQYFNKDTVEEKRLRADITKLWEQMNWNWYTNGKNVLYWHWSEKHDWKMDLPIQGYNEALIVYVLAAASPTHSISDRVYHEGWANYKTGHFANGNTYYGIMLPLGYGGEMGGPLFYSQYSHLGLDPRGLSDQYANYWEQVQRHTLINRAYAIDNPRGWKGYGPDFWGLTSGDDVPDGYTAHTPGNTPGRRDLGTITPTGALSAMPYTPEHSMAVLKNLYYNHGKHVFGPLGFYDGINLSVSDVPAEQVRKTYIGIDQGPIIAMIENYRSGLLWKYFMKDPDVRRGLDKLGFKIDGKKIQ